MAVLTEAPYITCAYTTDTNSTPTSLQIGGSGSDNMGRIPAGVGNKIALTVKNTYGANAAMTLFQPPASLGVPSTGIVISKPGLYAFNAFGSNTGFRNIFTISSGGTATGYLFNNAAVTAAMTAFNLSSSTTATFILTTAANQLLCLIVKTLAGTITTSGRSAT